MSLAVGIAIGLGIWGTQVALRKSSRAVDRKIARGTIPQLYPSLTDGQLCHLFGQLEAARLRESPRVMVVPFGGDDERSRAAGRALAALVRRDLSLVQGVSTRGSEDSPSAPLDAAEAMAGMVLRNGWWVGGNARLDASGLGLELWVARADHALEQRSFRGESVQALCTAVVEQLCELLEGRITDLTREGLAHGHPSTLEQLERAGGILELAALRRDAAPHHDGDLELEARALALLAEVPQLSILAPCLSDHRVGDLLRLYAADSFDAALCFRLYCALWRDVGFQREAFQFVRRALELCPAHGKANMVASHAGLRPSELGHHSELGFRLLPDNSFAVSNYAHWLASHTKDHHKIVEVARAGIDLAPQDPANYEQLIDAYEALSDFERALEVANELLGWFEPLHPRTRYCLYQNPVMRERIERGQYDPAKALRQRITQLESKRKAGLAQGASASATR